MNHTPMCTQEADLEASNACIYIAQDHTILGVERLHLHRARVHPTASHKSVHPDRARAHPSVCTRDACVPHMRTSHPSVTQRCARRTQATIAIWATARFLSLVLSHD